MADTICFRALLFKQRLWPRADDFLKEASPKKPFDRQFFPARVTIVLAFGGHD